MSKIRLCPFLNFQGRAREAMEFYHKVLGGRLDLQAMNAQGTPAPATSGERIGHARLEAGGLLILASDGHPDYPAKVGDNMAIALGGADKERLSRIFSTLAEGGRTLSPLARQPWGAEVGWLVDRFSITWTVTIEA